MLPVPVAAPQMLTSVRRAPYRHSQFGIEVREIPTGEVLPEHLRQNFAELDILVFYAGQNVDLEDDYQRKNDVYHSSLYRHFGVSPIDYGEIRCALVIRENWQVICLAQVRRQMFVIATRH